ncbi:unnamed protein product [Urochloa humidicola]
MASESGSTSLIRSPSPDTVPADVSTNEQRDTSATSVICIDVKEEALAVQCLSELIFAPNYCPPMFDPIFSPVLDIISADLSYENSCGSEDSLLSVRNYQTLQDDNKVGSSNYWTQELNDSATSCVKQMDAATTSEICLVDESVSNNITDDSACSNGEDDKVQGRECADQYADEDKFDLPVGELGRSMLIRLSGMEIYVSSAVVAIIDFGLLLINTSYLRISIITVTISIFIVALWRKLWLRSAAKGDGNNRGKYDIKKPDSMLNRLTGIEIYVISAVVVITAYGQLLMINMSYVSISIIPATILLFIAAMWRKLWLRSGLKGDGSNRGKYDITKVRGLVFITALPYCFLLLDVLVRNKVKDGSDDLVVSDFFSFLSSALGAVVVMIALLPVAYSSPGGAQVLQLIHRTCIIVLTITVHTKAAEWVREDMVLVCTQELVTALIWFTIAFWHGVVRGGSYSGKDGEPPSPANVVVEVEREEWTPNIITIATVMYMVFKYVISPASESEAITRALRTCSFCGCLNCFSMHMLQQWPGSAPVSGVPVKVLQFFAEVFFAAAAVLLVAVLLPATRDDFMTSLLNSPDQTILSSVLLVDEFEFLSANSRFLRSIAIGILYHLSWRLKTNAGRMERPWSAISDVRQAAPGFCENLPSYRGCISYGDLS